MDLILPLNVLNPCPSEIYRYVHRQKSPPPTVWSVMQIEAPFLSFSCSIQPLYVERPRDRVTRERIDEIRNADHDGTIAIKCIVCG